MFTFATRISVLFAFVALLTLAPALGAQTTAKLGTVTDTSISFEFSDVTSAGSSGTIFLLFPDGQYEIPYSITADGTLTYDVDETILAESTSWEVIDDDKGDIGSGVF